MLEFYLIFVSNINLKLYMKLSVMERKALILEAYQHQKDLCKAAEQADKKEALKKMRACSVYATAYNVSRLTASKFADIINRYHKHTRITIDFIVEDIRINSI